MSLTPRREEELCGECKPKTYPPWENMIKRSNKQQQSFTI